MTETKQVADKVAAEVATFGAGCFWGVEEIFRQVPGVMKISVGYMGGHFPHPTYEDVSTDMTGHAEVAQVTYDPTKVKFEKLLDVFWKNHNPTTPNQQGPDHGSQYRSVIFFHTPAQQEAALASVKSHEKWAKKEYGKPIVTTIEPAGTFWEAEDYHQQYFAKQGISATCHF